MKEQSELEVRKATVVVSVEERKEMSAHFAKAECNHKTFCLVIVYGRNAISTHYYSTIEEALGEFARFALGQNFGLKHMHLSCPSNFSSSLGEEILTYSTPAD